MPRGRRPEAGPHPDLAPDLRRVVREVTDLRECRRGDAARVAFDLQLEHAMPPVLVKHIMNSPAIALFAEQTLPLAEDIMHFKHLRHLPVIDDTNRLVGLVSHRDLLRAQVSSLTGLTDAERRARQDHIKIAEIMTRDVWTVLADTPASNAGRLLLDHQFGCLPVVNALGALIGIVTERDYLRFAIKAIEMHD
jgi:CBS-domain-containing membrane protein